MLPEAGLTDEDFAQAKVAGIRRLLECYPGERVMVGEVGGIDMGAIRRYVTDELFHLAFNFPPLFDRWRHDRWRRHIDEAERHHDDGAWPAWVLSNHDVPRHGERYGTEARTRAAAVLLLGLRGTAFLYAGEELGLRDAEVGPERRVDPGQRDGCRAPIPWTPAPGHGWGTTPWLPFPTNASGHDVETLRQQPGSILHLYRRLLQVRKDSAALRAGGFGWAESPEGVLAWHRHALPDGPRRDERLVAVSFVDRPMTVPLQRRWVLEVSSAGDGTEAGQPWDGALAADEAVIARPA
jgi:alpha-glucosidase